MALFQAKNVKSWDHCITLTVQSWFLLWWSKCFINLEKLSLKANLWPVRWACGFESWLTQRLLPLSWDDDDDNNIYNDLMPKGVQEKRTEVLENKVDRMWVSNAFFEWTHVKSSTNEGRRQCCSSFLRNLTFTVVSVWFVTLCWTLHITTSPHHCAANHAVNCKNPTDLTRCDPHEYYQVNCCSVSHRTVCYAWFVAIMFNIHPILNIFKWIKSNTFWNINSYSLIEQYVTRKIWGFFFLSQI